MKYLRLLHLSNKWGSRYLTRHLESVPLKTTASIFKLEEKLKRTKTRNLKDLSCPSLSTRRSPKGVTNVSRRTILKLDSVYIESLAILTVEFVLKGGSQSKRVVNLSFVTFI